MDESVPPRAAGRPASSVYTQRRWILHAELHSDAGNDADWTSGGRLAEVIVNEIANKALHYHALSGVQIEEFEELAKSRTSKYLANFSIFQSIPDSWSIEQLFPVMPLTRLNERASKTGVIMDITCDSDGCLDKFVDKRDVKNSLELHVPQSDMP